MKSDAFRAAVEAEDPEALTGALAEAMGRQFERLGITPPAGG